MFYLVAIRSDIIWSTDCAQCAALWRTTSVAEFSVDATNTSQRQVPYIERQSRASCAHNSRCVLTRVYRTLYLRGCFGGGFCGQERFCGDVWLRGALVCWRHTDNCGGHACRTMLGRYLRWIRSATHAGQCLLYLYLCGTKFHFKPVRRRSIFN